VSLCFQAKDSTKPFWVLYKESTMVAHCSHSKHTQILERTFRALNKNSNKILFFNKIKSKAKIN
jgi:hypothetical protein